jgi:hypothetical protein
LYAELGGDLRGRTPIPVDVDDKSFLGDLVERAIGLSLCDRPPYLDLFSMLGESRAARLLRIAAHHSTSTPESAGLFLTAHRLAQINKLLNPRWSGPPDPDAIARLLRRHPDALPRPDGSTNTYWLAFMTFGPATTAAFAQRSRRTGT